MLGRTDSRRRLLFLLVVFVRRLAGAGRPPGLLAGRRPRAAGRRGAGPDDGHARDAEQARRHLRPDRHGRPGHDRPARAPRRGARPADARDQRRQTVATLTADPRARRPTTRWPCATSSTGNAKYVILRARPRARRRRPDPGRHRRQDGVRRCRSSRSPSASTRRPAAGPDSTPRRAPARLRQPRGRRPVRRRAGVPGARSPASRGSSSPSATRAARPILDDATVDPGRAARGRTSRLTIDAGLQLRVEQELLAAWVADRAKRVSAVVHGPVHRRGLRDGDLPVLRRQRLQGDRRDATRRASSTRSWPASTSRARCSR